jgi:hypothetical protein
MRQVGVHDHVLGESLRGSALGIIGRHKVSAVTDINLIIS